MKIHIQSLKSDDPLSGKRSTRHELKKLNGDQKQNLKKPEELQFDRKEIVKETGSKNITNRTGEKPANLQKARLINDVRYQE